MDHPRTRRITFLGAAGTVTGSRFLVETDRARVLVDCGLFQGGRALRERNWRRLKTGGPLDAVVLTHGHLDHCGYLPRLAREGYRGPVHCTVPSADLVPILLRDAAWLEEEDARRRLEHGEDAAPLFTVEDAEDAVALLRGHPNDAAFPIAPGVTCRFVRSGHILGSACVELDLDGFLLVVTGDLGRYGAPLMRDPEPVRRADALVIESTYGDRDHPDTLPADEIARVVRLAVESRGVLLMPAFAVGRTQETLYVLRDLEDRGVVPKLPVYVDSPMATDVTELFCRYPEELDPEQVRAMQEGRCRISTTTSETRYTRSPDESKALNAVPGPAVILSASGMLTGGRILHHLRHRLPDPRTIVCFTGWMAQGTLGRRILDGTDPVRIHGHEVPVRARIEHVNGLSAHADRGELARWLDGLERPPDRTFVVHGEPAASAALAAHVAARGWSVTVPGDGDTASLADEEVR